MYNHLIYHAIENQLMIKRYAPKTGRAYLIPIKNFLNCFAKDTKEINTKEIKQYLQKCVEADKISFSTQKNVLRTIKPFFKVVFDRKMDIDYLYPERYEHKLPKVLSQAEVKKTLSMPNTTKIRIDNSCY